MVAVNSNILLLPCPYCESPDQSRFSQVIINQSLRWYRSTNCHYCHSCIEEDGIGFPENTIRSQLILSGGIWRVKIKVVTSKYAVFQIMKNKFLFDQKDIISILNKNNNILYSGTKIECNWLIDLLIMSGETAVSLIE